MNFFIELRDVVQDEFGAFQSWIKNGVSTAVSASSANPPEAVERAHKVGRGGD